MSLDIYLTRIILVPEVVIPAYYKEESIDDFNITHNLGSMAAAAGIYKALWRPEELFEKPNHFAKIIFSCQQNLVT